MKFTDRGVETTQEDHTEWLIRIWNSQVAAGDLVYHLGDFSFFKNHADAINVINRLKGNKIFIKGNHDNSDWFHALRAGHGVAKCSEYEEIKIDGNSVVLFHFPIASWHKQSHGSWHLHGHCHGNLKEEFRKGKILDVGIDNAYNMYGIHRFFSEYDIVKYMNKKEKVTNDHHREDR